MSGVTICMEITKFRITKSSPYRGRDRRVGEMMGAKRSEVEMVPGEWCSCEEVTNGEKCHASRGVVCREYDAF